MVERVLLDLEHILATKAAAKADDAEDAEHWLAEMLKDGVTANEACSILSCK